jgi:hypothetical protein
MSDIIFGNNAVLQVGISGTYFSIGCAVSCVFDFENELIPKTDVNAGLFRKKRVRMSDCSMSVQGLTTLVDDTTYSPMYFLQEGVRRTEQDLRILFTDEGGISKQIQGSFLVRKIQLTGKADDFSEFDMEFDGTGAISLADPDDSGSDIPGNIQFDWWEGAGGETSITGPGHYGRSFSGESVKYVDIEGIGHELVSGTPGNREYANTGSVISFQIPLEPGGRVYVLWETV